MLHTVGFGEGVAALAMADAHDCALQRRGDPARAVAVVLQQVERHALRRLDADAGQATQRLDEAFERGFSRSAATSERQLHAGRQRHAGGQLAHLLLAHLLGAAQRRR